MSRRTQFERDRLRTERSSLDLVSETVDDFGLRTDEDESSGFDLFSEFSVLGQETVSGVDHRDAMLERNLSSWHQRGILEGSVIDSP